MYFTQEPIPAGKLMVLHGPFTFKDYQSFREMLELIKASPGQPCVIDLHDVNFLDSAALGMLMIAEDETRPSGTMITLRRPAGSIAKMLELASMDVLFRIES